MSTQEVELIRSATQQAGDALDARAAQASDGGKKVSISDLLGQLDRILERLQDDPREALQVLGLVRGGLGELRQSAGLDRNLGQGLAALELPVIRGFVVSKVRNALRQIQNAPRPDARAVAARYGKQLDEAQAQKLQRALDQFVEHKSDRAVKIIEEYLDGKRDIGNALRAVVVEVGNLVEPGSMSLPPPPRRQGLLGRLGSALNISTNPSGAELANALEQLVTILDRNPERMLEVLNMVRVGLETPMQQSPEATFAQQIVDAFDNLPGIARSRLVTNMKASLSDSAKVAVVNVDDLAAQMNRTLDPEGRKKLQEVMDSMQQRFIASYARNLDAYGRSEISYREVLADLLERCAVALETKVRINTALTQPATSEMPS